MLHIKPSVVKINCQTKLHIIGTTKIEQVIMHNEKPETKQRRWLSYLITRWPQHEKALQLVCNIHEDPDQHMHPV